LPALDENVRSGFIREIASGNLSGTGIASGSDAVLHALALRSFSEGYATLFGTGAGFCLIAAMLSWRLVRASDTPPIAKKQRRPSSPLAAAPAMAAKGPN